MTEKKILNICFNSRHGFSRLEKLGIKEDLSEIGKELFTFCESFYNKDTNAETLDKELLVKFFENKYMGSNLFNIINSAIENIIDCNSYISETNIIDLVFEQKKKKLELLLASSLMQDSSTEKEELLQKYLSLSKEQLQDKGKLKVYNNFPLEDVLEAVDNKNKYKVYPQDLNTILKGGLYPGNNVLIYGRPEIGKSALCINMACGFIVHNHKVLYIINEDPAKQLIPRFISRLCEKSIQEIQGTDKSVINKLLKNRLYENLFVADLSPGTFTEIEELVVEHKPAMVFIDQLRNIYVGKQERVIQLERAAILARNLAKKHNIVCINVTQAGDSAQNKLYLDMGDVDFSNTGIPGQMDLMIGVGANEELIKQNLRVISLAKNKISGDHTYFTVQINPLISKVQGL